MTSAPRVARSTEGLKDRQPPVKGGRVIVVAALGATQAGVRVDDEHSPQPRLAAPAMPKRPFEKCKAR